MQSPLATHRWQHRVVLMFAPENEHPLLLQQLALREADATGWSERNLFYFVFTSAGGHNQQEETFSAEQAAQMYQRYEVATDSFVVILVGKDGGEKLRHTGKVMSNDQLFETIDAMPMRRREMREQEDPR